VTGRETRIISPSGAPGQEGVSRADGGRIGAVVRAGGVVLFPTESFYALGGDPLSLPGLEKVFRLKGRTRERTLLLLLDGPDRVGLFADSVPEPCPALMERFWPGPLTLLFPANRGLPEGIVSPRGEVALRVPGSPLSRAVLAAAGGVLTGTSANVTGTPPTVDPRAALRAFDEADLLVDGGTLPGGRVSTLLALKDGRPVVLREGAVGRREVEAVLDRRRLRR
jgi:L-threonylcarbamoyladenylate synthase